MSEFMNWMMITEAMLLSFMLALWITWLGLSGLFRLMPAISTNKQRVGSCK